MKNFAKFALPVFFSILFIQACTKDRVPSPEAANAQLGSQVVIYSQNFDSAATLPTGWAAAPTSGWQIKNTNPSSGYTGASANNNMDISNAAGVTQYDTVTSKSISTAGYTTISISYGVRNSSNFPDSGSTIVGLYFSIDGGSNWSKLNYNENTANSTWSLINNGERIVLPTNANNLSSGVMFRWVAYIVSNPNGSYRFDDFQIFGTSM